VSAGPFYGKYRGSVVGNVDPERMGRIQASVPDVLGDNTSSWAMPCLPLAGQGMGLFTVPPVGSGVWVEFERGDPDYPVWTGGFWGGSSETPSQAQQVTPGTDGITLQTTSGHVLQISDVPGTGGLLLQTASGAKISISDTGIVIDNGKGAKIELSGPSIDMNSGALKVT